MNTARDRASLPAGGGLPLVLVAAWACMSSAAVVIVLAAPVPPLTIAASRVTITALVWLVIARWSSRPVAGPLPHRHIAASGALLGLHFALWIGSLSLTSVTHAAVLVSTQPLFAGLFGLWLGDRANWRLGLGVVVALVGTWWMTGHDVGETSLLGDSFALLAAACSAAYLSLNRRVRHAVPLSSLLWRVNGWAAVTIVALAVVLGHAPWDPRAGPPELLSILWLGLVPGLMGHGLMNLAARSLPVHVVSLTILLEPVGAALAAWWILGQRVGASEAAGAALLLVGAAIAMAPAPASAEGTDPD